MAVTLDWNAARRLAAALVGALALLAGCQLEDDKVRQAIEAANEDSKKSYEAILAERGTRTFKVTRAEAYDAVRIGLARLGMTVETQDPVLGFVNVYAPAPRPLTQEEWNRAAEADLPRLRKLVCPIVGEFACSFIKFEPEGLQVTLSGTVVSVPEGTAISFTARMREIAPPKSGWPRREYLPPTAVRYGLDKMWAE